MKMLFDRTEELGMYVVPGLDYNWRLSATGNLSYIDDQGETVRFLLRFFC